MDAAGGNFAYLCGCVIVISILQGVVPHARPEITLSTGIVKGWRLPSRATNGTRLFTFKGIPYATPPLGALRFKAPLPVANWTGVKNLSEYAPVACPQNQQMISGPYSEDCLFINVYTPEHANSTCMFPVMVWIHGGAYFGGTGEQGGDYLVEQGIIFVSFNYRLGALGFLNLGTEDVPGNAGLKDQNLALQWVKKEIINFGGDPNKVTLFGQSAGAASVVLHYLSPKSDGLFRNIIAESGNALAGWTFMASGFDERAKALAVKLNCTNSTATISLTCLQKAKVEDIITYQDVPLTENEYVPGNSFAFVPTLEKQSETAILADTPENLLINLLKSNRSRVPIITGTNKDEGLGEITGFMTFYKQLQSLLKYYIPQNVREKVSDAQMAKKVASIYEEYFDNTAPSASNIDGFVKIYTDKMFALSIAIFARKIVNWTPTYLYHFDYDGKFKQQHTTAMQMNYTKGVNHGDEMGYIFVRDDLNQSTTPENTTEKRTLRKMVKMWTNFAKYMNPTPVGNESVLGNFTWHPISNDSIHYMRVTTDLFAMSSDDFQQEAVSFWSKIDTITSLGSNTSFNIVVLVILACGSIVYQFV